MPHFASIRPRATLLQTSTNLLTCKCGKDAVEQQSLIPGDYMHGSSAFRKGQDLI